MNAPFQILQITDLHILADSGQTMSGVDTEKTFRQVLNGAMVKHPNIDLILITGDLAQNPCPSSYQRIAKELEKHQIRTLCLPGNHDDVSLMENIFNTDLINCNKHFRSQYWQVICLNSKKTGSQSGFLEKEELDYLSLILKKNAELYTVIAVHHHPVSCNSLWVDKMIIENSDELFRRIHQHPQVKVINCGHIHQELEKNEGKQLILGSPSTCFQFKPQCTEYTLDEKNPGYRILGLYSNGDVRSEVYRLP